MHAQLTRVVDETTESIAPLLFYSIQSPGMPPPGPNFLEEACRYENLNFRELKDHSILNNRLNFLYQKATFDNKFTLKVRVKNSYKQVNFIPGRNWRGTIIGPSPARFMIINKCVQFYKTQTTDVFDSETLNLISKSLAQAGADKNFLDDLYVTNLVKFINPLDNNRLSVAYIKDCLPILHEELRIVRPDVILCLGSEVIQAVLGKNAGGVNLTRGREFKLEIDVRYNEQDPEKLHRAVVVTTINPAAVFKNPENIHEFNFSIKAFVNLCKQTADGFQTQKTPILHQLKYKVIRDEDTLASVVDEIVSDPNGNCIAIDSEWQGKYPTEPGAWLRTIQFSHKPKEAYIVVLREKGGTPGFQPSIEAAVPHLKRLLVSSENRKVRIIGHNLRADLPWLIHGLDQDLGLAIAKQFEAPHDDPPEVLLSGKGLFGWQKTAFEGGFDTMLAAHAVQETAGPEGFKLESLCFHYCGIPQWNYKIEEWKREYCSQNKISAADLEGYGDVPDNILFGDDVNPCYAGWDVAGPRELFDIFNSPGGFLDKDQFGNCSRKPFWLSMSASPACLEMEMSGVDIDISRAIELANQYKNKWLELVNSIRETIRWPDFNPRSSQHCINLLFGDKYSKKIDPTTGDRVVCRPDGALTLDFDPILSTSNPPMSWEEIKMRNDEDFYTPSTDKEVLSILLARIKNSPNVPSWKIDVVRDLLHLRYLSSVIDKTVAIDDTDGKITQKGLLSWIHSDGKIRTHIFQTKETGRFSSARPPMQNLSKKREADYAKIFGSEYKYPLRSIIHAPAGYYLVEADYVGAELYMMAVQANDAVMIDHCERAVLPDSDPRKFDLHSNIAVKAFDLRIKNLQTLEKMAEKTKKSVGDLGYSVGDPLPPTKSWLEANGDLILRDVAKTIIFGIPYGRGINAILRAIEEQGVTVSRDHAQAIYTTIFDSYKKLEPFLNACKERVYVGWLANWYGRYRRFPKIKSNDKAVISNFEREAVNFPIQGGVADLTSEALRRLYYYPNRVDDRGFRYKIILTIHDACLFLVREDSLDWFIGNDRQPGVVYKCMSGVPVFRCNLDGKVADDSKIYNFAINVELYKHWSVPVH